jgi:hypothetical protein
MVNEFLRNVKIISIITVQFHHQTPSPDSVMPESSLGMMQPRTLTASATPGSAGDPPLAVLRCGDFRV